MHRLVNGKYWIVLYHSGGREWIGKVGRYLDSGEGRTRSGVMRN